jgi:Domain of unknown function (DUF4124)
MSCNGLCFIAVSTELRSMRAKTLVLLAGLSIVLVDAAVAAKIFKWVDEKGITHYGEIIPPEYNDQAATEMSNRGVTLRKWGAAAKPVEQKVGDEQAAREKEEKQRAFEQHRRDVALVNTYTSAREIDDVRDRTMQLPTQAIRGFEPRLKKAQEKLGALQQQAATYTKTGKPVPDNLAQDIEEHRIDADSLKAEIDRSQTQLQAIKDRYEADKRRYLELTQR